MIIVSVPASGGEQPTAPTIGTASSPSGGTASVAFTASSYTGKGGTVTYVATSSPGGITGSSTTSPITVTGLTNGTAYTFTVTAQTSYGVNSPASAASNSVTPTSIYWLDVINTSMNGALGLSNISGTMVTYNRAAELGHISYDSSGNVVAQRQFTSTSGIPSAYLNASYDAVYNCINFGGNGRASGTRNTFMFGSYSYASNTFRYLSYSNVTPISSGHACLAGIQDEGVGQYVGTGRFWDSGNTIFWPATATFDPGNGSFLSFKYWTQAGGGGQYSCISNSGSNTYIGGSEGGNTTNLYGFLGKFSTSSATFSWAKKFVASTGYGAPVNAVGSYLSSPAVIGSEDGTAVFVALFNSSGTLQWQRKLTGYAGFPSFWTVTTDSSNNVYLYINDGGGNGYLVKYNSSGVIQWQRSFTTTTNPMSALTRFSNIAFDGTNNTLYLNSISTYADLLRYPIDGSVTGTYTYSGSNLTIAASSLTDAAGTCTISALSTSSSNLGTSYTAGTGSVSSSSYTATKVSL